MSSPTTIASVVSLASRSSRPKPSSLKKWVDVASSFTGRLTAILVGIDASCLFFVRTLLVVVELGQRPAERLGLHVVRLAGDDAMDRPGKDLRERGCSDVEPGGALAADHHERGDRHGAPAVARQWLPGLVRRDDRHVVGQR